MRGTDDAGRFPRLLKRSYRSCGFWGLVAAALLMVLLQVGPTFALDPQRSLSQAFHRVWQVPQGLPQSTINAILQTSDGYLWLGTPAGLVRFDGVRFITIASCAGIPAEMLRVRDLCEDRSQNIWIATDGTGLVRYRGATEKRYDRTSGMPSDAVNCVMTMRDGATWAGTERGAVRITDRLTVHDENTGLAVTNIRALTQSPDGTIWVVGFGNHVCSFDGRQWTTHELTNLPASGIVRAAIAGQEGAVWFGTSRGLIHWRAGEETCLTRQDGLADESVYCLYPGSEGTVWVGTRSGFSRLDGDEISSFGPEDGLSNSSVYAIYEDREGSLWVGTKSGLNQFNDRRTVPFTVREGLPGKNVGPLCNGADGTIWVGTLGAGLARFDGKRFTTLTVDEGLASNTIKALACDENGRIWVGTDRGLNCLENRQVTETYTSADGLPADVVTCICPVAPNTVWIGTRAGVAQLRDGQVVPLKHDLPALQSSIRALYSCDDGSLFIAAPQGVYRFAGGEFEPFAAGRLGNKDISAIYQEPSGALYLATQGDGLFVSTAEGIRNITTRDGLLDDELEGLLVDDNDRFWMASGSGLSYTPRQELLDFATGKTKTLTSTPLRLMDATRSFEVQEGVQPCILKSSDGRIWQSTTRGLMMVDPNRTVRELPPTPVVIEEVIVNGEPRKPGAIGKLSPDSTNLAFEYTALSLVVPMRITFRYKLEGFDKDWIEAGSRREAFYTNLPPGKYQFRVVARNVDENYWEAAQPVAFTILPHFYQTFWFLPACAVVVGLAGLGIYRLRVRRIKEQMRAVVAERSRIARELHDTLMQGFSGVTMEMQALAARLPQSGERLTLEEIIQDAANCVRDARRSVAGLRHDPAAESGLTSAIAQAARHLTETGDFRLKLDLRNCPRTLPVDVEYNLLRIAQEAIANAVKHSGARSIDVTLDASRRRIELTVADDGVGFASSDATGLRSGHYGLIGMRERARQIGATLTIDAALGQGTTVSVVLPMPDLGRGGETSTTYSVTEKITPS